MKNRFLFPNKYKRIGWLLTALFSVLLLAMESFNIRFQFLNSQFLNPEDNFGTNNNLTDELVGIGLILGLLFLAFSKEKVEDEQIARVRLESLQWSIYFNYIILLLSIIFIYGTYFLTVMEFNMLTPLIFFLLRFHYVLYKQNKLKEDGI